MKTKINAKIIFILLVQSIAVFSMDLNSTDNANLAEQYFLLGENYWYGNGGEENKGKAIECYKLAIKSGHIESIFKLGMAYWTGAGVAQDHNAAVRYFIWAASKGYDQAQYSVGTAYWFGKGVEENPEIALAYLRMAADNGNSNAKHNLGVAYWQGLGGLLEDKERAINYFKEAAKGGVQKSLIVLEQIGNVESLRELGIYYQLHNLPLFENQMAMFCFENAARLGDRFSRDFINMESYMQNGYFEEPIDEVNSDANKRHYVSEKFYYDDMDLDPFWND